VVKQLRRTQRVLVCVPGLILDPPHRNRELPLQNLLHDIRLRTTAVDTPARDQHGQLGFTRKECCISDALEAEPAQGVAAILNCIAAQPGAQHHDRLS
jgi:hypothetical protein